MNYVHQIEKAHYEKNTKHFRNELLLLSHSVAAIKINYHPSWGCYAIWYLRVTVILADCKYLAVRELRAPEAHHCSAVWRGIYSANESRYPDGPPASNQLPVSSSVASPSRAFLVFLVTGLVFGIKG